MRRPHPRRLAAATWALLRRTPTASWALLRRLPGRTWSLLRASPAAGWRALRRLPPAGWGLLRRHWLLVAFLLAGAALRALAMVAYRPALELNGDSYAYLLNAAHLTPDVWHPIGYPLLLRGLSYLGPVGAVTALQHLIGLGLGVLLYALLLHVEVRRPLAALAALPVLLGAYQVDIEQFVLSETLVDALLLCGLALLLWRRRTGAWRAGAIGLVLAAAVLTRIEVLLVLVMAAAYLLARRHWRALLAFAGVAAITIVSYGGWYAAAYGVFGYSDYSGYFLYGRTAPIATCDYHLPAPEAKLCPRLPVSRRSQNAEFWIWEGSPLNLLPLGPHRRRNTLALRFSEAIIVHQPLAYASAVLADTWHYFTPGRWMSSDRIDMQRWRFPLPDLNPNYHLLHISFANAGFANLPIKPFPDPALMAPLRRYQDYAYTEGPILLAALVGGLWVGLRVLRRSRGRRMARWTALVLAASGLLSVLVPSVTVGFSYRYGIPLLILLPPAGIIAADLGLDSVLAWRARRQEAAAALGELVAAPAADQDVSGGEMEAEKAPFRS